MSRSIVLIAQLSEVQGKLWESILSKLPLEILRLSPDRNCVDELTHRQQTHQALPSLLLIDMGLTIPGTSGFQAPFICRWCAENAPDSHVVLTCSRDRVRTIEHRWATRVGAVDLLPTLHAASAHSSLAAVARWLGIKLTETQMAELTQEIAPQDPAEDEVAAEAKVTSRDDKTVELMRKMAMIPILTRADAAEGGGAASQAGDRKGASEANDRETLSLTSTVQELPLFDATLDVQELGQAAIDAFQNNPLLPGIILQKDGQYLTMISRRRFTECLARPFGLELFSKRPLEVLIETIPPADILTFLGSVNVMLAAQRSLERPVESLYEPLVVHLGGARYKMLDVHDLFLAQSRINELATRLLREETQAHMLQTDRMALLGQMMAEITHDIKNPVNFIYNNIEYLREYTQNLLDAVAIYEREAAPLASALAPHQEALNLDFVREDLPKVIHSIAFGAEQLRKLVNGMQTVSRVEERDDPSLVNAVESLEHSLTILGSRLKQDIEVIKQYENEPLVSGYPSQLIQVFMNLISNAIDALLDERVAEKLGVDRRQWQPKIFLASTTHQDPRGKSWGIIRIGDNGPGIPPELQDRVFQSFFTTKGVGKGTGLGLSICYQIVVEKHGGRLTLKSPWRQTTPDDPGGGAEFELWLPLADASVAALV